MALVTLDEQVPPTAPGAGVGRLYIDSVSRLMTCRNNSKTISVGAVRNANTAAQAYTTAEIYLAGSALAVPGHLMQVGATFRWGVVLTKTAGTGAPVWIVRVGTAGTTADTARITFTQAAAGTSVTDTAWVDVVAVLRNTGASGVLAGGLKMTHVLATTGFSTLGANVQQVTSAGFDTTVAASIVGLTFNHGTAGAGNIEVVSAELVNS